jgi:hypothetical protein
MSLMAHRARSHSIAATIRQIEGSVLVVTHDCHGHLVTDASVFGMDPQAVEEYLLNALAEALQRLNEVPAGAEVAAVMGEDTSTDERH